MNDKIKGVVVGLCTLVELGCIAGLAAIGLKRNNDCYKAEMKLIDSEFNLAMAKMDNVEKDIKIAEMEEELKSLKNEEEA